MRGTVLHAPGDVRYEEVPEPRILKPTQFDQDLKQRNSQNSLEEMVRDAIQQRLTGRRPVIEDVARDLHMSSRTLQRRLQEEGSSYQRVLDEARHQMARYFQCPIQLK